MMRPPNCIGWSVKCWRMPETVGRNRFRGFSAALSVALLLLAAMPFLFGGSVSTMYRIETVLEHGYALAFVEGDPDDTPGLPAVPTEEPLLAGTHRIYPLEFFTVRDTVFGDVLLLVNTPGMSPPGRESLTTGDIRALVHPIPGGFAALISAGNTSSWPVRTFRAISGNGGMEE